MSGSVGPIVFYIITIMPLNTVTLKPKTTMRCFLNAMFKHPKLRIVTQTLKRKHSYQIQIFFWGPQFSVFKHLKLLFELMYQTNPNVKRYISYTAWMTLNHINSFIIAKMLPKPIRCKYNKLIMGLQLVHRYCWFSTQYWLFERFWKEKFSI